MTCSFFDHIHDLYADLVTWDGMGMSICISSKVFVVFALEEFRVQKYLAEIYFHFPTCSKRIIDGLDQ